MNAALAGGMDYRALVFVDPAKRNPVRILTTKHFLRRIVKTVMGMNSKQDPDGRMPRQFFEYNS